ncbi:unnamed protein product [Bursaphelenchus okinawaensis]|uniref:Uncharacterized protein n=1 Tax=Bursaphelenchus okinawaensis TaxID=465554 RepID=A0A811LU20_9BILA|nr:unnamed protein product [Bursaphelenchus okinawaensis]CAG9128044.1 unnamed protein product [Bursaphelenchus okinawaensis]
MATARTLHAEKSLATCVSRSEDTSDQSSIIGRRLSTSVRGIEKAPASRLSSTRKGTVAPRQRLNTSRNGIENAPSYQLSTSRRGIDKAPDVLDSSSFKRVVTRWIKYLDLELAQAFALYEKAEDEICSPKISVIKKSSYVIDLSQHAKNAKVYIEKIDNSINEWKKKVKSSVNESLRLREYGKITEYCEKHNYPILCQDFSNIAKKVRHMKSYVNGLGNSPKSQSSMSSRHYSRQNVDKDTVVSHSAERQSNDYIPSSDTIENSEKTRKSLSKSHSQGFGSQISRHSEKSKPKVASDSTSRRSESKSDTYKQKPSSAISQTLQKPGATEYKVCKLPPISDIPKFSGELHEFPCFWDYFEVHVHNTPAIPSEKILRLKHALTGSSVEHLVQNVRLTQAMYDTIIKSLHSRYNKPDDIITVSLHQDSEILKAQGQKRVFCVANIIIPRFVASIQTCNHEKTVFSS